MCCPESRFASHLVACLSCVSGTMIGTNVMDLPLRLSQGKFAFPWQVKSTVPNQINQLLLGVPTTVNVKGLQLNTSLVQDPEITPSRLVIRDWGRFKNPAGVSEVSMLSLSTQKSGASSLLPAMLPSLFDGGIIGCLMPCQNLEHYTFALVSALPTAGLPVCEGKWAAKLSNYARGLSLHADCQPG